MRLDQVLPRTAGPGVAAEIAALRTPGRLLAAGVHQTQDGKQWQFRFVLNELDRSWVLDRSDGPVKHRRERYEHGVWHNVDGPIELPFERAVRGPIWMAMPERMVSWGRGHESFAPMLVQKIGRHSLLLTFEHEQDPAFRTTLVVDERDGIARRRLDGREATIITDVRPLSRDDDVPPPRFEPLTDWIRPEY